MSLESQANDRKSRLAALRNKRKQEVSTEEEESASDAPVQKRSTTESTIKSRNFDPETRSEVKGFDAPPTALDENSETVEAISQKLQDEVLAKFRVKADITSTGLAEEVIKPKSLTWDLKRDIQDDLDFLESKTKEAISSFVRERIRKLKEASTEETD